MIVCLACRRFGPPCPASAIAVGLAGLGVEVHVLLAPDGDLADLGPGAPPGLTVHRLPSAPTGRLLGRLGGDRARRAALSAALRAIDPRVIHLADGMDAEVVRPGKPIVVRSLPAEARPAALLDDADAVLLPDGRLADRLGRPIPSPGVPPRPTVASSTVDDGLDPAESLSHWRALAYLAALDELSRARRVRLDPPHRPMPRPRRRARLVPTA